MRVMQMPALVPVLRQCAIAAALLIVACGGAWAQALSENEEVAALKQAATCL
jgi:hypothetical protein